MLVGVLAVLQEVLAVAGVQAGEETEVPQQILVEALLQALMEQMV
jgi:hypothetical protein